MSTLSSHTDNMRMMARLVREYDPAEVARMLRESADVIDKLNALVCDMWAVFECDPYGSCEFRRQCDENYECVFKSRLRELGIEVDG